MKKRNINEKVKREQDPIPWRYCLLTLICGVLLVVGFFWAARQHFSAMDFGIKNAKLRQQKESLESEQRLLDRNREISLSPSEIKRVAKKLGLQDLTANIEVISSAKDALLSQTEGLQKTYIAKTAKVEKAISPNKTDESVVNSENTQVKAKSQVSLSADLRERVVKK